MNHLPNISLSFPSHDLPWDSLELLQQVERKIPASVKYTIKRYKDPGQIARADAGMFVYHTDAAIPENNFIELRFCVSGNLYCRKKETECDFCQFSQSNHCLEKTPSIDFLSFTYRPNYLLPFAKTSKKNGSVSENILSFRHPESFSSSTTLNSKLSAAIEAFLNHPYTDSAENIFINAQTQILLLYAMDLFLGKEEPATNFSKFLRTEEDREKIIIARGILLEHIGNPITIKALSRKVAINECYLKKGFKEVFGTTIFDFYQGQRMEHAKFLLTEKKLSVTEVSASLGYSSISHFSTAFKKHTGIKPCELLQW